MRRLPFLNDNVGLLLVTVILIFYLLLNSLIFGNEESQILLFLMIVWVIALYGGSKQGLSTNILDAIAFKSESARINQVTDEPAEQSSIVESTQTLLQRLTFHLENSPLAVVEWDSQFRVSRWSREAEELFGWQAEEVIGKHPHDWQFVFTEDAPLVGNTITQLLNDSEHRNISRNRNYRSDGAVIYCEWYNSALLDKSGNLVSVLSLVLDVTDRKQAEEELRKSKEQLEIILRGVADGITVQDSTKLIYANDAAAKFVGYPSVEALLQTPMQEITQQFEVMDDCGQPFPLNQLPARIALGGKQSQEILLRYRLKATGEERWSLVKATPIFNDRGQVQFAINIFHDITERKQIEETQRFLAEASTILSISLDYQKTLENLAYIAVPYLADWCGVSLVEELGNGNKEEFSTIHFQFPILNTPLPIPQSLISNVVCTGKSQLYSDIADLELTESNPKSFMVVPLLARGRILGAIAFLSSSRRYNSYDLALAEDLARRAALAVDNASLYRDAQETKEQIRRYANRLQVLAEASRVFTSASLELQAVLNSISQHLVELIGDNCIIQLLSEDRKSLIPVAVRHHNPEASVFIQELLATTPTQVDEQLVSNVIQTNQPLLIPVLSPEESRTSIKSEYWPYLEQFGLQSLLIVPLRLQGQVIGLISMSRDRAGNPYTVDDLVLLQDLSDRAALVIDKAQLFEKVQQELHSRVKAEADLRAHTQQLANITNILAETNIILAKRNQELDQFAYIVSHDLKAPLRAIANLSSWIEEDIEEYLSEENKHQMNLLRGRVHRMEDLINGLLDYSRIGRIERESEVVDIGDLIAEVIDSLAPPPTFTIQITNPMPTLITERLPLEQVFANLIGNSIKHHHRQDGLITISAEDRGEVYEFTISDDGPGIAPQYHDKVFVIFQTLEARDKVENTGVGLAIVKKIIENKGGKIHLESEVGRGATFRFTLPKEMREKDDPLVD